MHLLYNIFLATGHRREVIASFLWEYQFRGVDLGPVLDFLKCEKL
jgi:hypothetical protein